ncbi:testis-expressed protein 52 [Tachyglossus aculeatus]|uniref:testis-expressed protein 52 n=1 Tax=Tachyglossus aculeatus TaxID=9261 RepID=UPI0018F3061C|nr:testis-expressed protein 52 [Tachyglossus aculeatus]
MSLARSPLPRDPPCIQREFLYPKLHLGLPGFSPRPYHQLVLRGPPCTSIKSQVRHCLRRPWQEEPGGPTKGNATWLEGRRLAPVSPARPNWPHDGNRPHWLRGGAGSCGGVSGAGMPPTRAAMPPPSQLAPHTYLQFIATRPLFLDPKRKEQVVTQMLRELQEAEKLKLKTAGRVPPLDPKGRIQQPGYYKRDRFQQVSASSQCRPPDLQLQPTQLPGLASGSSTRQKPARQQSIPWSSVIVWHYPLPAGNRTASSAARLGGRAGRGPRAA